MNEIEYAKPEAATQLAAETLKPAAFTDHELSAQDRAWASEKFARDWKRIKSGEYGWVREHYLEIIGVAGDRSVLPLLREIMMGDAKSRETYYAVNAITRLVGKDVRPRPVEEMDVEATRSKVLQLLDSERK